MHKFHPETLDPRRAGQITRYHTWPRIREQSIGEHSWQNIRILLAIWPDVPRHLLIYAMFHDIGEIVGDIPWPMKNLNPLIQQLFDEGEELAHRGMMDRFLVPEPVQITPEEKLIFKLCEYLEMYEWGEHEFNLGNKYAWLVMENMYKMAAQTLEKIQDQGIVERASNYLQQRISYERNIGPEKI